MLTKTEFEEKIKNGEFKGTKLSDYADEIRQLKAENERLKEENKNYCKDFIEISQQLKEKEQEIVRLVKQVSASNILTQAMNIQDIKQNTINQVCDKIRKELNTFEYDEEITFSSIIEILDEIEKGE